MKNATVTIEDISPKIAAEMLATLLDGQRKLREAWVTELQQILVRNEFRLTPDALLIVRGSLGNGQHRLTAVIRANRTAPFIVMRSDDEALYECIDSGIKRKVSDVLTFHGFLNSHNVAAIAAWIVRHDARAIYRSSGALGGSGGGKTRTSRLSRADIIAYSEKNREVLCDLASRSMKIYSKSRIVPSSIIGAFLAVVGAPNLAHAERFISDAINGGTRDDAAQVLHNRLVRNLSSSAKLPPGYVFALILKAYRADVTKKTLGTLKLSEGEDFPYWTAQ